MGHRLDTYERAVRTLLQCILLVQSIHHARLTGLWRRAQDSNLQALSGPTVFKTAPSPPGHTAWWKDLYLLKHLILDGAGLPVTARATRVSLNGDAGNPLAFIHPGLGPYYSPKNDSDLKIPLLSHRFKPHHSSVDGGGTGTRTQTPLNAVESLAGS